MIFLKVHDVSVMSSNLSCQVQVCAENKVLPVMNIKAVHNEKRVISLGNVSLVSLKRSHLKTSNALVK